VKPAIEIIREHAPQIVNALLDIGLGRRMVVGETVRIVGDKPVRQKIYSVPGASQRAKALLSLLDRLVPSIQRVENTGADGAAIQHEVALAAQVVEIDLLGRAMRRHVIDCERRGQPVDERIAFLMPRIAEQVAAATPDNQVVDAEAVEVSP